MANAQLIAILTAQGRIQMGAIAKELQVEPVVQDLVQQASVCQLVLEELVLEALAATVHLIANAGLNSVKTMHVQVLATNNTLEASIQRAATATPTLLTYVYLAHAQVVNAHQQAKPQEINAL